MPNHRTDANSATAIWHGLIHDAEGNPATTVEVARAVLNSTPEADPAFDPAPIDAEFGLWLIAVKAEVNDAWWACVTHADGFEFSFKNRHGDVYIESEGR
jgi:hypothetical protein